VATVGFVLLSQLDVTSAPLLATLAVVVVNTGLSPAMTVAVDGIISAVPAHKAGASASISETGNELGIALGTALLGSVLTVFYRRGVGDLRGLLSEEQFDQARETLGAAERVAGEVGGTAAATVRAVSRAAFVDGLWAAGLIAAVLTLLSSVAVAVTVRRTGGEGSGAARMAH